MTDTRYAFDVVVNGPLRSMIRVKTMNWNTGAGTYELEQVYTSFAHQNYSTCRVRFTKFAPKNAGVMLGCGIRKIKGEYDYAREGNALVSIGNDEISSPDDPTGSLKLPVAYVGTGLVVKDTFRPQYRFVPAKLGNHTFAVAPGKDRAFETCCSRMERGRKTEQGPGFQGLCLPYGEGIQQPASGQAWAGGEEAEIGGDYFKTTIRPAAADFS